MSKIQSTTRRGAHIAVGVGAAAVGIALATVAPAHADAFVRLPGGSASGDGLTLTRTHESAQISPSMAANGIGRTAWVSADITLKAPKLKKGKAGPNAGPAGETTMPGTNNSMTDGAPATLSVGYIVGCQVSLGNLTAGLSGTITSAGVPGASGTLSFPITPGQVVFAQIDYKDITGPGTYFFNYDRVQLQVQGCGGYAQARSFVTVETTGSNHQKVNLYGKPFSIG